MELVKVPPTLGRLTVLEGYAASEGGWEDSATLSARSRTSSFAVVEEDDGEEQGEVQSVAETMAEDEGGVREWVAPFGVLVLERVRALMDFAGVTDAEAGDGFTEGIDDGDEDGNDDFGEDENSKAEEEEETVQVVMGRLVDTLRSIGAYDFVAAGMEEKLENDDVDAKWAWHDEGSDNNEEGLEAFKLVI
ncbi:hypothetical protein BC830DRAFT_1157260 [Chytriomyces sp. MP71]|nr:hypothetical protein BC830DRAFT_1157260 [Chytriomyces sp. MP71]